MEDAGRIYSCVELKLVESEIALLVCGRALSPHHTGNKFQRAQIVFFFTKHIS